MITSCAPFKVLENELDLKRGKNYKPHGVIRIDCAGLVKTIYPLLPLLYKESNNRCISNCPQVS